MAPRRRARLPGLRPLLFAILVISVTVFRLGGNGAVLAQSGTEGSHDTSLPIEITADSMEVDEGAKTVLFTGAVAAKQGDLRLTADAVTVHYAEKAEGGGRTISSIEARGNVFVSSLDETAQGDEGVYDVTARTIRLVGNVVLTRGENVIRGQSLDLDLAGRTSRVQGGGEDGRVKGLFVPENATQP